MLGKPWQYIGKINLPELQNHKQYVKNESMNCDSGTRKKNVRVMSMNFEWAVFSRSEVAHIFHRQQ